MIFAIVTKEIRDNLMNFRAILFTLLCLTLVPFSLYVNGLSYQSQLESYNERQRAIQEERQSNDSYDLQHFIAYRPPKLLYIFANGIFDQFPLSFMITTEGVEVSESPSSKGTLLNLLGNVDYTFVLQMVLSLLTLFFAADVMTGEKEDGTLRLILSNPVSRGALFTGKTFGVFVTIGIPFTMAFLLGLLVVGALQQELLARDNLGRLFLIYGASIGLLSTYSVIGVAVSCFCSRSRTAVTSVVLLWVLFQLILPKAGPLVARVTAPVESNLVQAANLEAIRKLSYIEEGKETAQAYLAFWHHYPTFEDMQNKVRGSEWEEIQRPIHDKYQRLLNGTIKARQEYYGMRLSAQELIAGTIAGLSPGVSAANLVTDIAGTGRLFAETFYRDVAHFQDAVERQIFSVGYVQRIVDESGRISIRMRGNSNRIKEVPGFKYHASTLADVIQFNAVHLGTLLLYMIGSGTIGFIRFQHYDCR